jgi:hypothetical protein
MGGVAYNGRKSERPDLLFLKEENMKLCRSALLTLAFLISVFLSSNLSDVQAATCTVEIINSNISGTLAVNSPVTFNVVAKNSCEGPIYYKYFYQAGYGTSSYGSNPWVKMTTDEYVTDSEINYTFRNAGKYIVVIWAFSDPNNLDANGVSIIGYSVEITAQGGTACPVDIPHLGFTGLLVPASPIAISVNASQRCGSGTMYYKYFYQAGYGTSSYGSNPWVQMNTGDYVTDREIVYSFPSAGNYIIVVWAVSDPNNVDTTSVPIIGANLIIGDGSTLDMIFDLEDANVNMPTTGNILMQVTEPGGVGSATYYGTQKATGPDFPLTGIVADTGGGREKITFGSQERPGQFNLPLLEGGTLEGIFAYHTDGTFNFDLRKDGLSVYKLQNLSVIQSRQNVLLAHNAGGLDFEKKQNAAETNGRRPLDRDDIDWAVTRLSDAVAREVSNTTDPDDNAPRGFRDRLSGNSEFQELIRVYVTCQLLSNRLYHKKWCDLLIVKEECKAEANRAIGYIKGFMDLLDTALSNIANDEWADYILYMDYPRNYEGIVRISSACSGDDIWTITLKGDGTLSAKMKFRITRPPGDNDCDRCTLSFDSPRTVAGTYDMNAHSFEISEYGITGHYWPEKLRGGGSQTVDICRRTYSLVDLPLASSSP